MFNNKTAHKTNQVKTQIKQIIKVFNIKIVLKIKQTQLIINHLRWMKQIIYQTQQIPKIKLKIKVHKTKRVINNKKHLKH